MSAACMLTDSKPSAQAFEKLRRSEFSSSPRVATFISTVSSLLASHWSVSIDVSHLRSFHWFLVALYRLKRSASNALSCNRRENRCQLCHLCFSRAFRAHLA